MRPWLVAAWTLAGVVLNLGLQIGLAVLVGGDLALLAATDPGQAGAAAWIAYLRATGLQLVLSCVLLAIPFCAVYRLLLRPEQRGFAYLRLGSDELRMTLLLLLVIGGWSVFAVGSYTAIVLLLGRAVAVLPRAWGASAVIALAFAPIGPVTLWLAVRLSLAGPAAFAERRIALPHAWRMTRGRSWALLGCVAISAAIAAVVLLLEYAAGASVAGAISGEGWSYVETVRLTGPKAALEPGQIAYGVVSAMASGVVFAALAAPAAAVYRALRRAEDVIETFA
jgi:hypothetical protein